MQYLKPVGLGPSSNTCPRWASHFRHITSVRLIPYFVSVSFLTFSSAMGAQKLGHPVPESNLVSVLNSWFPQQMHLKIPFSCHLLYLPVNGLSVPLCRVTS